MSSAYPLPPLEFRPSQLRRVYSNAAFLSLLMLAFLLAISVGGGMYGVVVIGIAFVPYAFSDPKVGLWLSLGLIMVASLIAPPAGFEYGYGYSPELAYWAIATCIVFAALLVRYLRFPSTFREDCSARGILALPSAFFAFMALSVFSGVLGVLRHYPLLDVAKQFYGCLLFCAYFLFALKFAYRERDIEYVVDRTRKCGLACALVYIVIYLALVPHEGFRKELTILSAYAGGLAVLYLPEVLNSRGLLQRFRVAMPMLAFLGVPLLAQYKRALLAVAICGLLAVGLRAASVKKRYLYTALAFMAFTIAIATNVLNPIGEFFSKYDSLKMLFPEDIQSSYSVYLRLEELRQVVASLGGVPMFGTGMGSTLVWYDPYTKAWLEQQTMATGWGYLIVKTGIVGTLIFAWFALQTIRVSLARPLNGLRLGLFLLFVFQLLQMVADPFFLNFMTSLWAGMTCGFLYVANALSERGEEFA